jgi:glucosylceramidase
VREGTLSGTPFQVASQGAPYLSTAFNASLPPNSAATFKWRPGASTVHEWLTTTKTTSDGSVLDQAVQPQPDLPVVVADQTAPRIVAVHLGDARQTMLGFGAAMTDAAAVVISESPYHDQIMADLFSSAGARLNYVRVPMGASDLATHDYSYDDTLSAPFYGALPDFFLQNFSTGHDAQGIVPLLQQARRLNPSLQLLGTPWSAPAWMKQARTFRGTDCGGRGDYLSQWAYGPYAAYFVKFLQAYRGYGLPVSMVSMQNEPHNCNTHYATTLMEPSDQARLARDLRPALDKAGFSNVGIMAWDHNWYEAGKKALGQDPSKQYETAYPQHVMLDGSRIQSAPPVSAVGYHCYGGGPEGAGVQSDFERAFPRVSVLFTECTGTIAPPNKQTVGTNLVNEFRDDLIGPIRNWARTSLYWSLALGADGTPNVAPPPSQCANGCGCNNCRGMITVNRSNGTYAPSEDYYYWEHFSKFVDPGAVYLYSTDPTVPTNGSGQSSIESAAFRNPDGSIVVVALAGPKT